MNGQVKTQAPSEYVQSAIVHTGIEKRKFIIYKATNLINGKNYIGQTVKTLKERKSGHVRKSEHGSKYCFHNAIKKYGVETFVWEIICSCQSKDEVDVREREFIKVFNAKVPSGYNMTDGGEGTVGCHPSEETRIKASVAQKMFIQRTGILNFLGKKHTAESRAKITAAQIGKKRGPHSAEHREKIRKALTGRIISEEQKIKISKTLTGYKHSAESRVNNSKGHKGLKHSSESKEKMRKAWIVRKQKSHNGQGYLKTGSPDYKGRT
jgi:group I intron endonuclease